MTNFVTLIKQWLKQRKPKQIITYIVIGLVLIFSINYIIPQNKTGRIESAEAAINSLYDDSARENLNPEINRWMIREARRKTERLRGATKQEMEVYVTSADEKLQVIQQLEAIYQDDLSENLAPENIPFKENLTDADIKAKTQPVEWTLRDGVTTQLDNLLAKARQEWATISRLTSSVNNLFDQASISRDKIQPIIQEINQIDQHSQSVKHHPQTDAILQRYYVYVDSFVETLHKSHEVEAYPEETLKLLYQTEYVTALIADTELDARPKVSFTFDDGPNDEFTPQVLEILENYNIQGTFFVLGQYVEIYPEMAKRIVDEGHIIANHTYDHPDLSQISDEEVLYQINHTQEIIEDATGVTPTLYRMPYGEGGERVFRLIEDLTSVTWNTDTSDWLLGDADAIHDNIMNQLSDDMLILLHDTSQYSVNALEKLIISLDDMNYNFVTPDELEFDYRY